MSRYILSTAAQGTDQWYLDRLGRATSSRAEDIVADEKTAAWRDYLCQLAVERITGKIGEDDYVSREMKHGIEQEPFARMAFEEATGALVETAGFAYLPTIMAGCSVDGFIEDDGIFEAKCPKSATHIAYILAGVMPTKYVPQVTHNLWITGRKYAEFVSFDPRMPGPLQLFRVRVERDEAAIAAYEKRVMRFLFEVKDLEQTLRERCAA